MGCGDSLARSATASSCDLCGGHVRSVRLVAKTGQAASDLTSLDRSKTTTQKDGSEVRRQRAAQGHFHLSLHPRRENGAHRIFALSKDLINLPLSRLIAGTRVTPTFNTHATKRDFYDERLVAMPIIGRVLNIRFTSPFLKCGGGEDMQRGYTMPDRTGWRQSAGPDRRPAPGGGSCGSWGPEIFSEMGPWGGRLQHLMLSSRP